MCSGLMKGFLKGLTVFMMDTCTEVFTIIHMR